MGKVVATYRVRITLREHDDDPVASWLAQPSRPPDPVPEVHDLEGLVANALYQQTGYFRADDIHVAAERTDK